MRVDSDSSTNAALQQQTAAREAERDAQDQIKMIKKQVDEAQADGEAQVQGIQDAYEKQELSLEERNRQALESERIKGYETMLRARRTQEAEVNRIQRQGEKNESEIKQFHDANVMEAETRTRDELRRIQNSHALMAQNQTDANKSEFELENKSHQSRMNEMLDYHKDALENLKRLHTDEYNRIKANSISAREQAAQKYLGDYKTAVDTEQLSLKRVNDQATQQLRDLRLDSASKLAAYDSRRSDPFYQMKDTQAQLTEEDNLFKLTARIPEHERDHVNVAIRGNQIVISGARQNSDRVEVAPGQFRETHSHQTYSETFPIDWPVDPKGMSREWEGDTLVVRIPKRDVPGRAQFQAKRAPVERLQGTRPDFPENLPLSKFAADKKGDPSPPLG